MSASSEPFRPSPLVQVALQYLIGIDPKQRQDLAELVCDTLGASPRFWRGLDEKKPENTACVVRLKSASGVAAYSIVSWDGSRWVAFNNSTVEGVEAWASLPD